MTHPAGKARGKSDLDIVDTLFRQVRALYKKEGGKFPDPILKSNWNYIPEGEHEASPHLVAKEINGYTWPDKDQMKTFMDLKDDGSTACGCWIYCGSYPGSSKNMMARRNGDDASNNIGMYPEWAWCWPLNRRIIYNRAAVNRNGEPWDADRWVVKWTGSKWKGDIVDGGPKFGPEAKNPFIMNNEGVGRLFSPGKALTDGPFTEHYEPMESPTPNLFNSQKVNPAAKIIDAVAGQFGNPGQYPYVATSYRVVEHWQAGAMTRNLPWLNELVPDMFCEISPSLAAAKGIKNGDRVAIFNARGTIKAYALVTERMQPLMVNGRPVEMIGLIWHFGPGGAATGDACQPAHPVNRGRQHHDPGIQGVPGGHQEGGINHVRKSVFSRYNQVLGMPGVPGIVQAVEQPAGREDHLLRRAGIHEPGRAVGDHVQPCEVLPD